MKKNALTLILFVVIGLLAGSIATLLLQQVEQLAFLMKSTDIRWHPKADLQILQYDLYFQVKLNLMSLLGIICAVWIYRKL